MVCWSAHPSPLTPRVPPQRATREGMASRPGQSAFLGPGQFGHRIDRPPLSAIVPAALPHDCMQHGRCRSTLLTRCRAAHYASCEPQNCNAAAYFCRSLGATKEEAKAAVAKLRNEVWSHAVSNGFEPAINRSAERLRCDMGDFLGAMSTRHFFAHTFGCGRTIRC
jgi:hypothetical protein